jgi:hypothetical protein
LAVARFGNGRPSANQDLLLHTIERSSLISVVAVNLSGATKITAWIIPNTKEDFPDQWIYFGNQIPITSRNTFETFKTAVNVGDKVYVKSESGNVSFFVNGVYDLSGTANVVISPVAPQSPQIGDVWINDQIDPKEIRYWNGSEWLDVGITGPPNVLTIGTVESADFGDPAEATITGTSPEQVLSLVLPVGDAGPANSLAVGSVTASDPDAAPEVTITGESPNQTINFVLPRGEVGPVNALSVGTVETVPSQSPAEVVIAGEYPNQTISFSIPEGPVGVSNVLQIGEVTAVGPDESPSVTIEGDSPSQILNFALQQGIQGPPGDLGTATITDLQDVTISGIVTDGSIIVYNATTSQWENKESSGNFPDLNMVIMEAY